MIFFVGLHHPNDSKHFERVFISINTLRNRKSNFEVNEWILDSGAFSELSTHGHYRNDTMEYVMQINRWKQCGKMLAAVTQDYMCEPWILEKTGLTIAEHQRLTIERYDRVKQADAYIMPVLQGFKREDYLQHLQQYGDRLSIGIWVGVGSVCKRNTSPNAIYEILHSIKQTRPDLKLHGFGLKSTALADAGISDLLHSADSMAWSFAARREGRDTNSWKEAKRFEDRILRQHKQLRVF